MKKTMKTLLYTSMIFALTMFAVSCSKDEPMDDRPLGAGAYSYD